VLEAFEEQACGKLSPEIRASCPLLGKVTSVEEVECGVRVRFADSVALDAASAHVSCHLAFAATRGFEGMEACPLFVKGVSAESDVEGHAIVLQAEGEAAHKELRKRMAGHASR
jgi:hypothetical protein